MARASKGGEVGRNGEFYRGGEFLPSTNAARGTWRREQARVQRELTRKVQVALGVWECRPSLDVVAIYSMWGNAVVPAHCTKSGKAEPHLIFCEYSGMDIEKVRAQIARFEAGEKWMPMGCMMK